MTFALPALLWLLAAPVLLLVLDRRTRAAADMARPRILRAEAGAAGLRLAPADAAPRTGRRLRWWLAAGLTLAVLALARPQWGRIEEPVFDQAREILLAVDLSRSMLTPDVKPSRLERAKLLIQSLLEKLAGERVGLVVFAGTAFLQAPLSADYEILREFLPALNPDFLPQGGSNYGALLDASLQAFGATAAADRFLVVLSDGEATDERWKDRITELARREIRVLSLGVGTSAGGMIPDGTGGLVKDERGAVVMSRLETSTLQELARVTGGTYRDASAWLDLSALLRETVERGQRGRFAERKTVRQVERYQWPLALALWCLLVSFLTEFPVRPKPRDLPLRHPTPRPAAAAATALLLATLLAAPAPAPAAARREDLAPPPAAAPGPAAASAPTAPEAPPPSPLGRMVGRLAAAPEHRARDWAELGRETITWGSQLKSGGQPIPEGPVQDALEAVALGQKLEAGTADWTRLRTELEELLAKPPEPPPEEKPDQPPPKQEQDKNQKKESPPQQKSSPGETPPDQQPPERDQGQPPPDQQSQPEKSPGKDSPPGEAQPDQDPALGDLNREEQPAPPPEPTQKVGGQPERKEGPPPEASNPALALPLQKLDQLRAQDSPAQLFQLMEGDRKPARKTGKDW
ncbi:MAG: VWA domain-containing protein [Verrucomicrobia bacterium]|nr:VWA domain-containing protein [Verrucomicrobiota bacterium]